MLHATGSPLSLYDTINAIASNPTLKSRSDFQQMLANIALKEQNISEAKKSYNGLVSNYNTLINKFPTVILQTPLGLTIFDYYI